MKTCFQLIGLEKSADSECVWRVSEEKKTSGERRKGGDGRKEWQKAKTREERSTQMCMPGSFWRGGVRADAGKGSVC
jgi:hypothetical protein